MVRCEKAMWGRSRRWVTFVALSWGIFAILALGGLPTIALAEDVAVVQDEQASGVPAQSSNEGLPADVVLVDGEEDVLASDADTSEVTVTADDELDAILAQANGEYSTECPPGHKVTIYHLNHDPDPALAGLCVAVNGSWRTEFDPTLRDQIVLINDATSCEEEQKLKFAWGGIANGSTSFDIYQLVGDQYELNNAQTHRDSEGNLVVDCEKYYQIAFTWKGAGLDEEILGIYTFKHVYHLYVDSEAYTTSPVATGECGTCDWSIDRAGNLRVIPKDGVSGRLGDYSLWRDYYGHPWFPWHSYSNYIRNAWFDSGVRLPENCSGLFYGCSSLSSLDASGWDTSQVTDMLYMFYGCTNLSELNVSKWDTSKVANYTGMFYGCSKLASLDLSSWNTSVVPDAIAKLLMSSMFEGCNGLNRISVGAKTTAVAVMGDLGGNWRSRADGKVYGATQLVKRAGIADTYTRIKGSVSGATVSAIAPQTYTGAVIKPAPKVTLGGAALREGADYTLSWSNNVNVGTATVTVTGAGVYEGSTSVTFSIAKAKNGMKIRKSTKKVKASKVAKKKQAVMPLKVTGANGKVTYKRVAKGSSKRLSVNKKNGKVTVKKGTKAGTYKIRIKVTAKGDANHKKATKTVTCKVVVK